MRDRKQWIGERGNRGDRQEGDMMGTREKSYSGNRRFQIRQGTCKEDARQTGHVRGGRTFKRGESEKILGTEDTLLS